MSETDRDYLQEERKLLTSEPVVDHEQAERKKKRIKYGAIAGGIIVAIIIIIVLSVTLTKKKHDDVQDNPFTYQEKNPFNLAQKDYQVQDWYINAVLETDQSQAVQNTQSFFRLQDSNDGLTYKPVDPSLIPNTDVNKWATQITYNVTLVDNYQFRVRFSDANKTTYSVSDDVFPRPVESFEARLTQVGYQQSNTSFSFSLQNIYNKEVVLTTEKRKLIISDMYSEMGMVLPTNRIYGLGQGNRQFQLQMGTYTLWSRKNIGGMPVDNAEGGLNGPHIHPFLLCQTANKDFFGLFFVGTTAQSFEIVNFPGYSQTVLNYITVGGDLEMYVIMRGQANEIIAKYHAMIGYSQMPPFYALGVFQGSDSYDSLTKLQSVSTNYASMATSPAAIEGYMVESYNTKGNYIFTVDPVKFNGLNTFVDTLHSQKQHIVMGVMTGISNDAAYSYSAQATSLKCLVSSTVNVGAFLLGKQYNTCYYPDYFNIDAVEQFYSQGLSDLNTAVHNFDGVMLQGAHLYNTINGEINATPTPTPSQAFKAEKRMLEMTEETIGNFESYKIFNTTEAPTYYLPFVPGHTYWGYLDNSTLSLNATHTTGATYNNSEYLLHNANGHMGMKRLSNVLLNGTNYNNKRALIYSDSTWAGSGNYGAALITDLLRTWDNLRNTISQVLSMSMYGISNTVTDVCGTYGPLDEELCARWMQAAAFLPMARNYYTQNYLNVSNNYTVQPNVPSEFYTFKNFSYQFAVSAALDQRLTYLRYTYSQMYQVFREGGALVKPLFFDYPTDDNCFTNIEHTYMLGDSLKVSPVLEKGVTGTYKSYFPKGVWADINNASLLIDSQGDFFDLQAQFSQTNVHLKAGKILPFQKNTGLFKTTRDLETQVPVSFMVMRDASNYSEGYVLVDDGISKDSYDAQDFTFWKLRFAQNSINFWVQYGNFDYQPPADMMVDQIGEIQILHAADLSGTDFACFMGRNLFPVNMTFQYDNYTQVLKLTPSSAQKTVRFADVGFIKFGNSKLEPNFCDYATAFTYKVNNTGSPVINATTIQYNITSKQGNQSLKPLVMTAMLMDNYGTINLNITTQDDYNNVQGQTLFTPPFVTNYNNFNQTLINPTMNINDFITVNADPFYYMIHDNVNKSLIYFQSDPNKLYFTQYMTFDSGIFSMNNATNFPLLGMGERAGSLFYTNETGGIHSRYAFDQANPIDDGLPPGRNMYGYQPFYAFQSNDTNFFGVFDLNSYATDYVVTTNNGTNTQITKIQIGGMIQKFFFRGPKPDTIIKTYQKLVGNPTQPPLWAFGWQQCRFGWVTGQIWQDVVQNYTNADLPLDTMWADIDYMDDYKIFTVSQSRYGNLSAAVKDIRQNKNMTFVPIMDAGVAARKNQGYSALDKGLEMDIFIKQSDGSAPLTAGVWCGDAYFPDFFHPKGTEYWHLMLDNLATEYDLEFDGIWLDENEATNFCNGYCITSERPVDSLRNKPFYVPGWRDLEDKALGVDGLHANGWHEYDTHNLFALTQTKATAEYLIEKKQLRPYVLSRSNYPGIGKYGHHWLGDNWSTVEYMALSVDGLYSYQLFGLPFMGCDICGFNGDAAGDLCTKWHQLGSLYPFSRNHNQNASESQEPYRFNTPINSTTTVTFTDLIRTALRNRYNFIRYYYSHFFSISEYGGSFFKPFFYEFPNDPLSYVDIQNNIMLGEQLKASILVTSLNDTTHDFYFPQGVWCQVLPTIDPSKCHIAPAAGVNVTYPTALPDYQIHIRNGSIVPWQEAAAIGINTTKGLADILTDILILPNTFNQQMSTDAGTYAQAAAVGYVYYDNGTEYNWNATRFDFTFNFHAANAGMFTINPIKTGPRLNHTEEAIGDLKFLFASNSQMAGATIAQILLVGATQQLVLPKPVYDAATDVLHVSVVAPDGTHYAMQDIKEIQLLP